MRYTTTKAAIGSRLSMRRALLLLHVAGAALLTIAVAGSARAQSTGIAACDDFLTKYDTCVTSKLPEAQRATTRRNSITRRCGLIWQDYISEATMEGTCKQANPR